MSSCAAVPATSMNSEDDCDPFSSTPSSEASEAFQETTTFNVKAFNNQFIQKLYILLQEMNMIKGDVKDLDFLEITKDNLSEKMFEYGFPKCIANVLFAAVNDKLRPYSAEQNQLIPVHMNVDNNYYFNKSAVDKYHAQLYIHPRFKELVQLNITNPETNVVTRKVIHLQQENFGNQPHYVFKHDVLTLQSIKDTILTGLTKVTDSRPDSCSGLIYKDNEWKWNPNDVIRITGKHKLQVGRFTLDVTLDSIKLVKKIVEGHDVYIPVVESDGMEAELVAVKGNYHIPVTAYLNGKRYSNKHYDVPTEWLDNLVKERVSRL